MEFNRALVTRLLHSTAAQSQPTPIIRHINLRIVLMIQDCADPGICSRSGNAVKVFVTTTISQHIERAARTAGRGYVQI